jgi:hypothetical protein
MGTSKSRLLEYLTFANEKKSVFYKKTGLGNGFLDKNDNINSDKLEIIISSYADLNLDWLVTGRGGMLRSLAPCEPDGYKDKYLDTLEKYAQLQEDYARLMKRQVNVANRR